MISKKGILLPVGGGGLVLVMAFQAMVEVTENTLLASAKQTEGILLTENVGLRVKI